MTNWKQIARLDADLRAQVDRTGEALAKLRWENTLGVGVAFAEYARQCGVQRDAVAKYANAWAYVSDIQGVTISDALVRVSTSVERYDVIEAIADARGTTTKAVQAHHGDEVRRVRGIARERAEERGTTVREEAEKIAKVAVRHEKADKATKAARSVKVDLRYLELERHLEAARRSLRNAVSVDVELTDENRELIAHAISIVRGLLELVERRFIGAADVDWDAELTALVGE